MQRNSVRVGVLILNNLFDFNINVIDNVTDYNKIVGVELHNLRSRNKAIIYACHLPPVIMPGQNLHIFSSFNQLDIYRNVLFSFHSLAGNFNHRIGQTEDYILGVNVTKSKSHLGVYVLFSSHGL